MQILPTKSIHTCSTCCTTTAAFCAVHHFWTIWWHTLTTGAIFAGGANCTTAWPCSAVMPCSTGGTGCCVDDTVGPSWAVCGGLRGVGTVLAHWALRTGTRAWTSTVHTYGKHWMKKYCDLLLAISSSNLILKLLQDEL